MMVGEFVKTFEKPIHVVIRRDGKILIRVYEGIENVASWILTSEIEDKGVHYHRDLTIVIDII